MQRLPGAPPTDRRPPTPPWHAPCATPAAPASPPPPSPPWTPRSGTSAVTADVTAGEYGYDIFHFQRLAPVVDCLQADVSRCGGITEWQRVAALAAAHNLDVSGHCTPALHVDAALATPNLRHLEHFHDHVRIENLLFDGVTPVGPGGALHPDLSAPGNGLTFKAIDVDPYRAG